MDLKRYNDVAWTVEEGGKIKAGPFLERWKATVCFDVLAMLKKGKEPKAQEIWVSPREKRRIG